MRHQKTASPQLAQARADLQQLGFAVMEGVFPAGDVAQVEAVLDELIETLRAAPLASGPNPFVGDMAPASAEHGRHQPELRYAACFRPALLDTAVFRSCHAIARALGGPVSRSFDHAIYKPGGSGISTAWHQDDAYAWLPFARVAPRLHFWIPLQDATVENGCMMYAPGSHRTALPHQPFARAAGSAGMAVGTDAPAGAVACPVRAGGLTVHTPLTLHGAGPNRTKTPRKAWIIQFSPLGSVQVRLRQALGRAPAALA